MPLTCAVGAVISGILTTMMIGRRVIMIIADFMVFIGALVCIISIPAENNWILGTGLMICSLSIGINSSIVPIYIKE